MSGKAWTEGEPHDKARRYRVRAVAIGDASPSLRCGWLGLWIIGGTPSPDWPAGLEHRLDDGLSDEQADAAARVSAKWPAALTPTRRRKAEAARVMMPDPSRCGIVQAGGACACSGDCSRMETVEEAHARLTAYLRTRRLP